MAEAENAAQISPTKISKVRGFVAEIGPHGDGAAIPFVVQVTTASGQVVKADTYDPALPAAFDAQRIGKSQMVDLYVTDHGELDSWTKLALPFASREMNLSHLKKARDFLRDEVGCELEIMTRLDTAIGSGGDVSDALREARDFLRHDVGCELSLVNDLDSALGEKGFEFQGDWIVDPTQSPCGRFPASPYTYGFQLRDMPDGSREWFIPTDEGDIVRPFSGEQELAIDNQFLTLQLGLGSDVPLQHGGTGPDEPVWYFDVPGEFAQAIRYAQAHGLTFVGGAQNELPPDEMVTDFSEFREYANLQREAVESEASLDGYGDDQTVASLYDDDEEFRATVNQLIPGFEYPDYSYMTVGQLKRRVHALQVTVGEIRPVELMADDTIKPAAIDSAKDTADKDAPLETDANQAAEQGAATLHNGRFIRGEDHIYRRAGETRPAIADEGDRIRFIDKQMDAFEAGVELAKLKGWGAIEVTGTDKFRAEAWFFAKAAGLEVIGYEASETDLVRLDAFKRDGVDTGTVGIEATSAYVQSKADAERFAFDNNLSVKGLNKRSAAYFGKMLHETEHHVVQDIGARQTVVHAKNQLNGDYQSGMEKGRKVRIHYADGQGTAEVVDKSRGRGGR